MLFEDLPALFGNPVPKDGLMVRWEPWWKLANVWHHVTSSFSVWQGVLVVSRPLNGCTPIDPPPPLPPSFDPNITKSIVLIRRYDCNFDIKVSNTAETIGLGSTAVLIQVFTCFRSWTPSRQDTTLPSSTTCTLTLCSTWTTATVKISTTESPKAWNELLLNSSPSISHRNHRGRDWNPFGLHQLLRFSGFQKVHHPRTRVRERRVSNWSKTRINQFSQSESDVIFLFLSLQDVRDPEAGVFFPSHLLPYSLHWGSWHDHPCDECRPGKYFSVFWTLSMNWPPLSSRPVSPVNLSVIVTSGFLCRVDHTLCEVQKKAPEKSFVQRAAEAHSRPQVQ